jgi:ubiquinone/menaquinone biosynthesis C-methylase UbiE
VLDAGREHSWWIFNVASDVYGWFTAQSAWRASCARVASHLPNGRQLRVLDLGCGPGVSTFELARARPGAVIIGLDLAAQMLRQARRRQRQAGLGSQEIQWLRADAARLPFGPATLDAVTGHSFLYLVPDRPLVLAECLRVLRPGGRFVTMEPAAEPTSLWRVLRVSRDVRFLISIGLWRPFSRFHGRFNVSSLCGILERGGFANCGAEVTIGGLGILAWAEKPW